MTIQNVQGAVPFKAKKSAVNVTVLLRNLCGMKPEVIWDAWYCAQFK